MLLPASNIQKDTKHYYRAANWSDSLEGRSFEYGEYTIDKIRVQKAIKLYPDWHSLILYDQT